MKTIRRSRRSAGRLLALGITLGLHAVLLARPLSAQEAGVQTVRGEVADRDSRAPLPGATVVVAGTDPLLGTTTDARGRFVLERVPIGRRTIRVTFVGYRPAVLPEVLVAAGKEVVLHVALQEEVIEGSEVVVVPDRRQEEPLNDMATVSARGFSAEETRRYAGGVDDPARMAAAFAGIASTTGVSENALMIRGNAPKGVLWRLEGVEIPNPSHFAGLTVSGAGGITLFSAQLLADSDVFTGAFPAEYGNALAGVFDMNFRTGNPARREHTVQAGLLGIDVGSEGPFRSGGDATYLFNYRYSTLALLMPLLPTEGGTSYQDLSFKLDLPAGRAGRFSLWGLGGLDAQSKPEDPDSSAWTYDFWDRVRLDLRLGVGALGLSHTAVLGARSYVRSVAAVTAQRTAWDQHRLDDALRLRPHLFLDDVSGRLVAGSTLNHKFGRRLVGRAGVTVQRLFYDLSLRAAERGGPAATIAQGEGGSFLVRAHAQGRFSPGARLTLHGGLHAYHFALTGRAGVEPRAGVRLALGAAGAVSAGYGLHSQIEELRFYLVEREEGVRRPNLRLRPARAHHLVLGYDRTLGPAARLKIEGYVQRLFDVPVVADSSFSLLNFEQDWTFDAPLVNGGAARNYGVEATVERFLRDGWYALLTGSLFRARYRDGRGVWRDGRFDQRYALNALAGREVAVGSRGHLLGVNGRIAAVGGRRQTPVDAAASRLREAVVLDERRPFADRMPGVWMADVTVTYRLNRRRFSEVWALQVKNVLAAKDVSFDYNYATGRVDEIRDGYPLPVLSYKVEF